MLYTASEGNHGRALAAVAKLMGVTAHVYVSHTVHPATVALIESEGAKVILSKGTYDVAMTEAHEASKAAGKSGLFVQDTSFEGYHEIPAWIVEGYSTLLVEADEQVKSQGLDEASIVVTPVGVGSLAHAVVRHCKSRDHRQRVVAVEPDTAASLYKSIRNGKVESVSTGRTIMGGLNCGTPSLTPFEELRGGVDACVTISDLEAHNAVEYLADQGVNSGPCGAATLAGLFRLGEDENRPQWLNKDSVVVILNTEGPRTYEVPLDVTSDDAVDLTQILTRINSANPDLSVGTGSSEAAIATYISAWLEHRDLEAHWIERTPGRPSVVGVLRGSGNGKSLMLNGHIDTVSLQSYSSSLDPLSGRREETQDGGRIYGRGSLDMKAGVAAAMETLARLAKAARTGSGHLKGDVLLAAVADEENFSKGTEDIIAEGWTADAAIIPEPTSQAVITAHKGFVWVELTVLGRAMHGSMPEAGVDAILLSGFLQTALLSYAKTLPTHPKLGQGSLHGGVIRGGEEPSSYAAKSNLTVEFRTVPPQTTESILSDMETLLAGIAAETPAFRYEKPRVSFTRPASVLEDDDPFVKVFSSAVSGALGRDVPSPSSGAFWCDAGLLNAAGVPSIIYGPSGFGPHAEEEWVSIRSIQEVTSVLEAAARQFCT